MAKNPKQPIAPPTASMPDGASPTAAARSMPSAGANMDQRNEVASPNDKDPLTSALSMSEIGVSGLRQSYGVVIEEFLPQLQGHKGVKVYRQMRDNDAGIGAIMFAITNMLRAAKWTAEPADQSSEAKKEAEFAESLLVDMSQTFEDFISEALTMLEFGWSMFEAVFKNRVGPEEEDPTKKSKFDDGRIGVRKLAPRAQDTLWRWEMQPDGGIKGMWQYPPLPTPGKPTTILLPIERCLLFRTTSRKNSPEGVSVLRNAYRSWWYATRIEEIEAIGVERDLAGLPVVRIPSKYFRPNATPAEKAILVAYQTIARDVKRNEQGGLVIPSDPWFDADGKPLPGQFQVMVELLSSGGAKQTDTDKIIQRHQTNIARSVLADFIMLGNAGRGSFALSKNKTDMFLKACETFLNIIASVLNRYLLPRVWEVNGLDPALMPAYKPGRIAPVDLAELGAFLRDFAAAGGELFPDDNLENHVREMADLPEKSAEAIQQQSDAAARAAELAAAARGRPPGQPFGGAADGGAAPQGGDIGKREGIEFLESFLAALKFDPDQARDDHGMWAAVGGTTAGATFASPNVGQLDFAGARQALGGARQAAFRGAMAVVDHEMGLRSQPTDAIGAWRDGAENSILGVVHGATWDQLKASAAMKGWLANQKQVLVFQHDGTSKDSYLASFHAGGKNLDEIHKGLLASGLEFHTLALAGNGATVYVYGQDQQTLDAAAKFAGANGAKLNVRFGHGEFIGTQLQGGSDAFQRADARKQYEAAIAATGERDGGVSARAWDRIRARYGQSLDAIKAHFLKSAGVDLSKAFNPDQARDEGGRWSNGGGAADDGKLDDRVTASVKSWLGSGQTRASLASSLVTSAASIGVEIAEVAILHEVASFALGHLGGGAASVTAAAAAVIIHHLAKRAGVTPENAKRVLVAGFKKVAAGLGVAKAEATDEEITAFLDALIAALEATDTSEVDVKDAVKIAAAAAAEAGVPVFVICQPAG